MKRIAAVVAVCGLAASLVACGSSNDKKTTNDKKTNQTAGAKGCPRNAAKDASYSGKFVGPVSMDERKHLVQVTQNGRPIAGAKVCVNTAMVGMRSMHYTAKGKQLAPGRYQVGFKFEMNGTYRGNLVTRQGGKEVSVPVTVKVPSSSKKSSTNMKTKSGANMKMKPGDKMKTDTQSSGK